MADDFDNTLDAFGTGPVVPSTMDDPPASPVLIDYRGDGETPAHAMAPLAVMADGAPLLVLQPGLNRIDAQTWASYNAHPALDTLEDQDQLVVGVAVPYRPHEAKPPADLVGRVDNPHPSLTGGLIELIGRTWSASGLDAIADAERAWHAGKPRGVIAEAMAKQRTRLAKRRKR